MSRELKRYRVWFDDGSTIVIDAYNENFALLRAQVLMPADENRKPVQAECLATRAKDIEKPNYFLSNVQACLIFGVVGWPLAILGWQCWFYLHHGSWKPLPAEVLLTKVVPANLLVWLGEPDGWVGAKILVGKLLVLLSSCPLSLLLLVCWWAFLALLFGGAGIGNSIKTPISRSS